MLDRVTVRDTRRQNLCNFDLEIPADAEIKTFCARNYGVTFPIFSKISVRIWGGLLTPQYFRVKPE